MSNLTIEQKYKSIVSQYQQHAEVVDWTRRFTLKDQAKCGCGILAGQERICAEFNRLAERMRKMWDACNDYDYDYDYEY